MASALSNRMRQGPDAAAEPGGGGTDAATSGGGDDGDGADAHAGTAAARRPAAIQLNGFEVMGGSMPPARGDVNASPSGGRRGGPGLRSRRVWQAVMHVAYSGMLPFPNLTVLDHPLISHKLTILRDRRTSTRDFKQLVNEIAVLMAYEVTKDLPLEPVEIETPLEPMTGVQLSGKKLTLVPILRAGLGMVEGIAELIPSARVGHIGLYRDHETLSPVDYYFKIPADEMERDFFVLDPMLATGGSAAAALSALRRAGARRIRFLCLVAAPEGVRVLLDAHPDVPVYAAALDRQLNEQGYILPGLGDAGDRLFGTR